MRCWDRRSDVDLERRTPTVAQSLEQTSRPSLQDAQDARSSRTIALSPSSVEELQGHRARQGQNGWPWGWAGPGA